MAFTVIESRVEGKYGDASRCEDALVVTPDFAAVIDGATSKVPLAFDGKTTGRWAAELLVGVVASLPREATLSQFVDRANACLLSFYRSRQILQKTISEPEYRLAASVAVYSDARREVWSVGDCRVRIGEKTYLHEKSVDARLSGKRASAIECYLARGGELDALLVHDVGRMAIADDLRRQLRAQNNPSHDEAYGVIDGYPPYAPDVRCYRIPAATSLVLATDGYPLPLPTLSEAERYLDDVLREDPFCFRRYKSTKGKGAQQCSFDDRAYLRLLVSGEPAADV